MSQDCIFCKIVRGEIPAKKIFENQSLIAFNDINPVAKVHFLLIPKLHVESLKECTIAQRELLGDMLLLAPQLAAEQGLKGFKTHINTGREGGQEVFHLHLHIIGNP